MRRLLVLVAARPQRAGARRRRRPTGSPRGGPPSRSARACSTPRPELILGTPGGPPARARAAARAYRRAAPRAGGARRPRGRPRRARRAARRASGPPGATTRPRSPAARGEARAALFRGAYAATLAAVRRATRRPAREWLLLREFRTATRFTRPDANATLAVAGARAPGSCSPRPRARPSPRTCSTPTRRASASCSATPTPRSNASYATRRAETAAQAAGYWPILADRYAAGPRRGRPPKQAGAAFAALEAAARRGDAAALRGRPRAGHRRRSTASPPRRSPTRRRRAAPSSCCASSRSSRSSTTAASATPRSRSTSRSRRRSRSATAPRPRSPTSRASWPSATPPAPRRSRPTSPSSARSSTAPPRRPARSRPPRTRPRSPSAPRRASPPRCPKAWQEPTDESDYDLIALTLDRMEAAVGAGQYRQAEQARLEAYAFFEFGPERRLKSFDPGLALDVEGLIWFGAQDHKGLAELIADRAPRREVHETRLALDELLADAAATLGDSANKATVVTNSAIIVFREGLEAVLILAAITASFVGVRRRLRRPVLIGAIGGLVASMITWVLAQTLLRSLDQYGEKLEAVVGPDRDRGAAADHELVLPQGLLERVDRQVPPPPPRADGGREDRLLLGAVPRPRRARAHERLPRGLRDGAVPAVAAAQRRHGDRAGGRRARARADARRRGASRSRSSASCPTRRC